MKSSHYINLATFNDGVCEKRDRYIADPVSNKYLHPSYGWVNIPSGVTIKKNA